MQYNCDIPNLNGGSFSFGSLPDFLRNRPSSFGALYPGSDTRRGLRQTMLAGYIQHMRQQLARIVADASTHSN